VLPLVQAGVDSGTFLFTASNIEFQPFGQRPADPGSALTLAGLTMTAAFQTSPAANQSAAAGAITFELRPWLAHELDELIIRLAVLADHDEGGGRVVRYLVDKRGFATVRISGSGLIFATWANGWAKVRVDPSAEVVP
jgi:hypothetical protein